MQNITEEASHNPSKENPLYVSWNWYAHVDNNGEAVDTVEYVDLLYDNHEVSTTQSENENALLDTDGLNRFSTIEPTR
jgi:hypothetical protein